jgi:DNA gyrase subunit A
MVVTVTMSGYIKRTPLSAYRAQRRGGKGKSAMSVREEDITTELLVVNTHTPVLFFSNKGQVYKLKVYKLPPGAANTRGKALVNLFPLSEGEVITTFMPLPEDETAWDSMHIFFATANGNVRRNDLSDFHDIRVSGKIAIRMEESDRLVSVQVCREDQHALLASRAGKCIRFPVSDVRVFKSRTSDGVRGMRLAEGDAVVSMAILSGQELSMEEKLAYLRMSAARRRALSGEQGGEEESINVSGGQDAEIADVCLTETRFTELEAAEQCILTVTENGYGKRSSAYEYRITGRGGSGIVNIITSERNGSVVWSAPVERGDQAMLLTDKATLIRTPVDDIRVAGRNTQGVTILRTQEGEKVVSVVRVRGMQEEEMDATQEAEE